jgi:pseudouridine synthase
MVVILSTYKATLLVAFLLSAQSYSYSLLSPFQRSKSSFLHHRQSQHPSKRQSSTVVVLHLAPISDDNGDENNGHNTPREEEGIRLNKVFKATHSRREADALIASGRVAVNGKQVLEKGGFKVLPHRDVIALDGKVIEGWEDMNAFDIIVGRTTNHSPPPSPQQQRQQGGGGGVTKNHHNHDGKQHSPVDDQQQQHYRQLPQPQQRKQKQRHFEYIKYWKPLGVTCTTDLKDNIMDSILSHGYMPRHRVYPVGRLDKESSGLILLTSDGRLPNAVLRGETKQPKLYRVMVDRAIEEGDMERLRNGIVITTVAQRDGKRAEPLTQRTKPCQVERCGGLRTVEMTLMEGRNRQIRKMMGALNHRVVKLQRTDFMGIQLERGGSENSNSGLRGPGDWATLDEEEMILVERALQSAAVDQSRRTR